MYRRDIMTLIHREIDRKKSMKKDLAKILNITPQQHGYLIRSAEGNFSTADLLNYLAILKSYGE